MSNPEEYETLAEAVEKMRARGFVTSLKPTRRGVECEELGVILKPSDLHIVECHRFEGITDPADESVLYAVETRETVAVQIKGVIIDAYGAYADSEAARVITQLCRSAREDVRSQRGQSA